MGGGRCNRRAVLSALGGVGAATLAGCSLVGEGPAIAVPDAALRDEPVAVELTGFDPETAVTVRAETTDFSRTGRRWTSRATFETDADGRVDLTERAPVSGSYEGVDGMGLFWSMTPAEDGADEPRGPTATATESDQTPTTGRTTTDEAALPGGEVGPEAYHVALRADVDGETVATATTTRRWVAADVTRESVVTDEVVGELFRPGGDGPHPGVLVLHGSGGRPWTSMARALASRGYAAFAVQYFGPNGGEGTPIPAALVEVPLSYFDRARSWLTDRPSVADRIGVVGASRGGEAALLVGAAFDWPEAVVGYAPSCYVGPGLAVEYTDDGRRFGPRPTSAWSRRGDPLPYEAGLPDEAAPEQRGSALADGEGGPFIPVERTDAPLAMISGRDDQLWPSATYGRRAVERLDAEGVDFAYDHLSYESAGHAIGVPYTPTATAVRDFTLLLGGTPAGDARAEADSWPRVLDTLDEALGERT